MGKGFHLSHKVRTELFFVNSATTFLTHFETGKVLPHVIMVKRFSSVKTGRDNRLEPRMTAFLTWSLTLDYFLILKYLGAHHLSPKIAKKKPKIFKNLRKESQNFSLMESLSAIPIFEINSLW